jgi:hypothetical protein
MNKESLKKLVSGTKQWILLNGFLLVLYFLDTRYLVWTYNDIRDDQVVIPLSQYYYIFGMTLLAPATIAINAIWTKNAWKRSRRDGASKGELFLVLSAAILWGLLFTIEPYAKVTCLFYRYLYRVLAIAWAIQNHTLPVQPIATGK